MTDLFVGLHRGPIDHEASSVINAVANEAINMGDAVKLAAPPASELLPRVDVSDTALEPLYGVVVGGDADGVYGDGSAGPGTNNVNAAALFAGDGVVVVTQGRCKARVTGSPALGAKLEADGTGALRTATTGDVIGIALQAGGAADMIAVDLQREGAV